MADADKTTVTADMMPIPFTEPSTLATINANGGRAKINQPSGGGMARPMQGCGNKT